MPGMWELLSKSEFDIQWVHKRSWSRLGGKPRPQCPVAVLALAHRPPTHPQASKELPARSTTWQFLRRFLTSLCQAGPVSTHIPCLSARAQGLERWGWPQTTSHWPACPASAAPSLGEGQGNI